MSDPLQGMTPEQYLTAFAPMRGIVHNPNYDPGRKIEVDDLIRVSAALNEGESVCPDPDPPTLFAIYEARKKGSEYKWGIRHYKGNWYHQSYKTAEEAQEACNKVVLQWLEGEETILIHSFTNCL